MHYILSNISVRNYNFNGQSANEEKAAIAKRKNPHFSTHHSQHTTILSRITQQKSLTSTNSSCLKFKLIQKSHPICARAL